MLDAAAKLEHWPQTIADFDRLIAATQDELIHFAFHRLGNRHDAEDVIQDIYVESFRDRAKRKHITAVRPYLFRIVGNRCIDLLRSRLRQGAEPIVEDSLSTEGDAFSSLAQREQWEEMNRLLDSIPAKEAEVIRLRAYSDLSFAEIAEVVGSSVPTVKSRFRYGLDKLRRKMHPKEACDEMHCSKTTTD
jgi:RNA polymerase sigma-70 factor (ECF subfamily)